MFDSLPPLLLINQFIKGNKKNVKAYGTGSSQAVPHPSTIPARRCLTSVIRQEPVYSSWYGRRQQFVICSSIYKQMRKADLCVSYSIHEIKTKINIHEK